MKLALEQCKIVEAAAKYRTMRQEVIDMQRKITDNRVYELDTYRSILVNIRNFDYRFHKYESDVLNDEMNQVQTRQFDGILSRKCKKCNTMKAPQSHHCSTCGRCVARMDHHCPWVNNCVGFSNQKHFLLFLVYVFLGSSHACVLIAYKAYTCLDENCAMFAETSTCVVAGVSIFLAILFGLFVCVMFCDQISCIVENTSSKFLITLTALAIDKLQKKRA